MTKTPLIDDNFISKMLYGELKEPPKLLSNEYMNSLTDKMFKDMMQYGQAWIGGTPYHKDDLIRRIDTGMIYQIADPFTDSERNLHPAEYKWSEVIAGIGMPADELHVGGRSVISREQALELGLDVSTLVRAGNPDSNLFFKPPKEYPMARAKQVKEVQYNTIGVRFLDGPNLAKVYTYRVPKKAKLHLGQEVVVPTDKTGSGYVTQSVAVVVEIHKANQDTSHYEYKFVTGTIKPL